MACIPQFFGYTQDIVWPELFTIQALIFFTTLCNDAKFGVTKNNEFSLHPRTVEISYCSSTLVKRPPVRLVKYTDRLYLKDQLPIASIEPSFSVDDSISWPNRNQVK